MHALSRFSPLLIIAYLFVSFPAFAQVNLPPKVMEEGGLYFPGTKPGTVEPAPLLKTEIDADISGPVARYTLRHTFINTGKNWTEAIYTYPLPSDSAVDRLVMHVGNRVIEGEIAEKKEAARRYAEAKASGRNAGLVSQKRPNVFSTSVANIAPGAHVTVEIGFQETLSMLDDGFHLRLPLVVGPHFYPAERNKVVASWSGTEKAPAEEGHVPTMLRAAEDGKGNPVTITVNLHAGFPLGDIESASHDVEIERLGADRARIMFKESAPAEKDFSLDWQAKPGTAPVAGLFAEQKDGVRYGLMMLSPPNRVADLPKPPREVVFVVDTSGSMHGSSIDQARAALRLALARLRPEDTFRIYRFSDDVSAFRDVAIPATPENVTAAATFVSGLTAEGGTEIVGAAERTFLGTRDPSRLTQVVLITDGAVGNEDALFDLIDRRLGEARLFTVGIGSAPNGYLMTRAARAGRGTYTFIQAPDQVAARMSALFLKLETPALTDVTVTWEGAAGQVEAWPNPIPDLYLGEPIEVLAALPDGVTSAQVAGRIDGKIWQTQVALNAIENHPGIAALWGREKIASLMSELRRAGEGRDAIRAEIVKTALKFGLVSTFTSLVAVDETPARPEGVKLVSKDVPANLPEGWSREHITGERTPPPDAVIRTFDRTDATMAPHVAAAGAQLATLPQTATAGPLLVVFGIVIMVLGVALTTRRRLR